MCARFKLSVTRSELEKLFDIQVGVMVEPRPDIRPTDPILVLSRAESGQKKVEWMRWGLNPHWAREDFKARLINARSETVLDKLLSRGR